MIYFDNAATSWPKPDVVLDAMLRFQREIGANPGRSGHSRANAAERVRFDAREAVAELVGLSDPLRVVFTLNATEALNLVINGLLEPGTHAVTTGLEHNAVMRPLRALEAQGVRVSTAPNRPDGTLDPTEIDNRLEPQTRLIILSHASNVCGTVLPVGEVATLARARGIPLLVDAAQTAGVWPLDMEADQIDLLAFSGHKGLLGPSGTGGLAIHPRFAIERLPPLVRGGTGSLSEHTEQPNFLPDKYESGTPNIIGLAGLHAGVRYVLERGVWAIRAHEQSLAQRLIDGLQALPGLTVLGTGNAELQTGVVSFIADELACSELAFVLDERYEILSRPGLHCAPEAHRTLGTLPGGTLRLSPSLFNTIDEVDRVLAAVGELVGVESRG